MRWSVVAVVLMAGCAGTTSLEPHQEVAPAFLERVPPMQDVLAHGPHTVTVADYDLGTTVVGGADQNHSDYEYEARMRGTGFVPDGDGPFPVALFLHGQHMTCGTMGRETPVGADDCSDDDGVATAYPNHRGYDYLAQHLASHGVAVFSILGYEVNARNGAGDTGMWARGELILATLDALAASELAPALDLDRVGIMGHSRGGEGVVTAVHVNDARQPADRHALRAVVALAPTDFNERGVDHVPLLSIVPYCDGDVTTLHGLRTFDHSRQGNVTKAQILVMGANHNYYNTMWAREPAPHVRDGDDIIMVGHGNRECLLPDDAGGGRLSDDDVRREAVLHINGFLRWFLLDDASQAGHFQAAAPQPPATCPLSCKGAVHVTWEAEARQELLRVHEDDTVGGIEALERDFGGATVTVCAWVLCDTRMMSSAPTLSIEHEGRARIGLAADVAPLGGAGALTFRVAVAPTTAQDLDAPPRITITVHAANASVSVDAADHSDAVFVPPGQEAPPATMLFSGTNTAQAKLSLNMVRIPLEALPPVQEWRTVEITAEGAPGRLFINDVLVQQEA